MTGKAAGHQVRRDPLSGRWVIYAPVRSARPHSDGNTTNVADCPFCPGNEHLVPGVLHEMPAADGGWLTRVVPNRFPILSVGPPSGEIDPGGIEICGPHELIIESPRHDADLADMAEHEVAAVLATWRMRIADIWARPGIQAVTLFHNRGAEAGASQPHPHSQLLGLTSVPPEMAEREARLAAHLRDTGSCLLCRMLEQERSGRCRLVAEDEWFLAFVPRAAEVTFECWIVPKRHSPRFQDLEENEIAALARMNPDLLRRQDACLGTPPGNLVLFDPSRTLAEQAGHWLIRLVPRLAPGGGFEMGTGVLINPSLPEADAELLRGAG